MSVTTWTIDDMRRLFRSLDLAGLGEDFPDDEYDAEALYAFGVLASGASAEQTVEAVVSRMERDWGVGISPARAARLLAALKEAAEWPWDASR